MDNHYRQCAINCVGKDTLMQYQNQFEACNHDFDLLFSTPTGGSDKCECSRQAVIYLYSQLLPDREITVETIQTVRTDAESCRFRIILGT